MQRNFKPTNARRNFPQMIKFIQIVVTVEVIGSFDLCCMQDFQHKLSHYNESCNFLYMAYINVGCVHCSVDDSSKIAFRFHSQEVVTR